MSAVAQFVSLETLAGATLEWADLCTRACEANPFAEPAFLLPLIGYERPHVRFVLVREGERLIGFAALRLPLAGLAQVWRSAYAPLPACAFDAGRANEAVAALLGLLERRPGLAGVVFGLVETGGAFEAALRAASPNVVVGATTRRVALKLAGVAAFEESLNPKRRTKWARQGRKLATQGRLETASGAAEIEAFLSVEPRGWKGARGTALADDPARLAFARTALGAFARAGRLDATSLRLNGQPIAAGLVLQAGGRGFYWKTGYDEAFAEASPGVQLVLAQTRKLAQAPGLAVLDSCAGEDHPMIGRIWPDVLIFMDVALALRGKRSLALALGLTRLRARGREALKRAVNRGLGRKSV